MIKTKRASKDYLKNASRDLLNKIVKQHNIKNTSRMKISDLRDLMFQKRVREFDSSFTEPTFTLRAAQIQPKLKDLQKELKEIDKKLKEQKSKTVKYVKKVVVKRKKIKGQKETIKDQDDLIKGQFELEKMQDDIIKDLEAKRQDLEDFIMNLK